MPPPTPIDPLAGPRFVLTGRVVTMDGDSKVVEAGAVYVADGNVVAAQPAAAPAPAGFEAAPRVASGGTIYPGLIELHNHLSYNALRLWDVPKKYVNRDQWGGTTEYRRLISGPMTVLGKTAGLLPAVIRFVEAKCLLGGVTTSQGVELFSNAGARRFYRGIVRNVEQTDEAALPEAGTKIADVDAVDAKKFLERLKKKECFLLHLSEGTNPAARMHFQALHIEGDEWAVTESLAGIHSAALEPEDFAVLGARKASMVWSPMSNLLLYGATADVKAARENGVRIGIGSDWSPSGSKNLLGELKVAHLYSEEHGLFSDRDIVAMATRDAASILGWEHVVGSIEPGKRADLLVVGGAAGDPYAALIHAKETDIRLVAINGVARYGMPAPMKALGSGTNAGGESVRVGGSSRVVFLKQDTADPAVGAITLSQSKKTLSDALARLPALAQALEAPAPPVHAAPRAGLLGAPAPVEWSLVLDEIQPSGMELRPRIPFLGAGAAASGPRIPLMAAGAPLSQIVKPLVLDALTVADDETFLQRVGAQRNLPVAVKDGLPTLY